MTWKEVDEIDAFFSAMTSCNVHLFLAFLFLAFLFLAFVRPITLTQHLITHMYIVLDRFIFVTLELPNMIWYVIIAYFTLV